MTPRVVIVGAGFAGLNAALALRRADIELTVVDRRNHHLFQPLLYQVATAALSPAQIATPIRRILRRSRNTLVLMAEAAAVDAARRRLVLDAGELPYDALILAPGAAHHYFGHPEWAAFAPGLKTIEDAVEIRQRVLAAFEEAERAEDEGERRRRLTFAVIGGGPTGVELAGALAEIARFALAGDFRRIDPSAARIVLVEAAPELLGGFPRELREAARRALERLGVEVLVGSRVEALERGGVRLAAGSVEARTVLWAAGVRASPLGASLGAPLDRLGRVLVEPDLSVPGRPEVFVAGDLASVRADGGEVPAMAPAAVQMGRHAAANAIRRLRGEPTLPFRYRDRGMMATIGRDAAVAWVWGLRLNGRVAWVLWAFVHILFLIGFRNRLIVMLEWAWTYATFGRGARLITGGRSPSER